MKKLGNPFIVFLRFSCDAGHQILDWIRTVYFSLISSAVMAFILRAYVVSPGARWFYLASITLFLIGLVYSVKIVARFKKLAERHKAQKSQLVITEYYLKEDKANWYQHLILYVVIVPALLCIYLAGKTIDSRAEESSRQMKGQLSRIEDKLRLLDSIEHHLSKKY